MVHEQDDAMEARRLITAFYNVRDREARRIIVAIVEAAARGAAVKIEGPAEREIAGMGLSSTPERTSH